MVLRRSLLRSAVCVATGLFSYPLIASQQAEQLLAAQPQPVKVQSLDHDSLSPFTADEARTFLAAAAKADKITDLMRRCLSYPDPPGSHWSREGVEVYCRYRLQQSIDFAELKSLVLGGNAAEVDRRLAEWAHDPSKHPEAFWRFLNVNFFGPRPESRDVLEAWKQQSPQSAFAHAASGFSFLRSAWRVRGGKYMADTPQERVDGMDNLLSRADGDLRRAEKLDPSLSAPYAIMMQMGALQGDGELIAMATKEGLSQAPTSFPIFDALEMVTEPRWFGSLEDQSRLLASIDQQAPKHPLLFVVRTAVLMDQADLGACECDQPQQRAAYRIVFDQVGTGSALSRAGSNALDNGQYEIAAIYLAEALRFDANDAATRGSLGKALAGLDHSLVVGWAGEGPGGEVLHR
jgi:hypothetical protein